jgi:N-acyl-D-amino-acid deacylase
MFDVLIKNAVVINGVGDPMYKADIGIRDDRIEKIGYLADEKGEKELDVSGRMVCPGFIDVNNQSDTRWRIFSHPCLESLIHQGITTIIGGNCGSSLAPLASSEAIYSIQKWGNINQINISWQTVKEFLKFLEKQGLAVNFGTLVGHGTLRRGLMKDATGIVSQEELNSMKKLLERSLKEGSLGMSSELIYSHERKTTASELEELVRIIKKYQGVYATHIRNEREDFLEALEETVALAEKIKASVHISHLKVMEEKNWSLMDEALALMDESLARGTEITFDVYPYAHTETVLYTLLPEWISEGGKKIMLHRLKDQEMRGKIIADMKKTGFDWAGLEISKSFLNRVLTKRKVADIASSQNKSAEETIVEILIASEGSVIVSMNVLSEKNVEKAILHPASIIATNGSGYNLEHAQSGERVHPRSFGTFPKVLAKYVMEKKVLSWEEAVKKMTSRPARKFGIKKRGEIREGFLADLVVVNMDEIKDLATAENPYQYNRGIEAVLINGKVALQEGKISSEMNGRILIRQR